ncbi:MAG: aminotransferase class IV [Betaproteobacteria bacterium]
MGDSVVFLNGQYVAESAASVSVFDRAFCAGDGIYDVARTFRHQPDKLLGHCERFCRSAAYTRIDLPHSAAELSSIARRVLLASCKGIDPADDRVLWLIATRGVDPPTRNPLDAAAPTVIVYTLPINYHRFAKAYCVGAHLITATTRRTPPECLDPRAKITNKMNHIQAELEVKTVDRDAIPLMLGMDGTVAEASWANAFFVKDGRVFTPRPKNILLGIMRENVLEIAPKAGVEVIEGDFYPYDFLLADEIFLTTTSCCILPVGRFNGRPLASVPGPVTTLLTQTWSTHTGVDFVAQAMKFTQDKVPT